MKNAQRIVATLLETDDYDDLFRSWEDDELPDEQLVNMPKVWLEGVLYAIDDQNHALINYQNPDESFPFESEEELWAYIEDTSGVEKKNVVSHSYIDFSKKLEPPKYTIDQKLTHEVFRYDDWVILKLPTDPDFIQREGISMQHCLSVAHHDYCERMKKLEIEVYSLTSLIDGEPKVDIEVSLLQSSYGGPVSKPTVTQIRGIRNECPPKDEYLEPIMAFFATKNWIVSGHRVRNFDAKTDGDLVVQRYNQIKNK